MIRPNNDGASAMADRMPPFNLEAERGVIGSCLMHDAMIDECNLIVGSGDFYRGSHQEAWAAMVAIRDDGRPVDAVTLADHLIQSGRFKACGGDEFLRECVDSVPHAANARYYASIVRERAVVRQLIEACTETLAECYGLQMTAQDLVASAEQRVFAISEREVGGSMADMDAMIGEAMDRIRRRKDGEVDGINTGFDDLDDVLCGLRPGNFAILAARPSIGKTGMATAISANVGARERSRVLFFSLEMTKAELGERYLSAWGEVNSREFKEPGRLSDAGWDQLCGAAGRLSRLPIRTDDVPGRTISQIAAIARREASAGEVAMIAIDYLGLVDPSASRNDSRQEQVAKLSRGLKRMARELKVPVLALHQLNRQPEGRDDRRPRLSDLRDSGAIEQDADIVMLLHRPEFYDPNDRPGVAEVIVAKNRNGPCGAVEVSFRKEWTRFDSLSRIADPAADGPAF